MKRELQMTTSQGKKTKEAMAMRYTQLSRESLRYTAAKIS